MQNEPLLAFHDVALEAVHADDTVLSGVNLALNPGELAVVHVDADHGRVLLADAAEGLVTPQAGSVTFRQTDWTRLSPDEAARRRGTIGRVFQGSAWINNLDLDENIALRLLHHTRRPPEAIAREADELARAFGFPEIPHKRPAWVSRDELQRAQWVRALMGPPDLLLLEFPEEDAAPEHLPTLREAVRQALLKNSAALWITTNPQLSSDDGLKPARAYRILNGRWHPVEKDS